MSLLLAVAAVLGAQAAPEPSDKVVILKRKAHTWSFAQMPERRTEEGLYPSMIWASWVATDPRVPRDPQRVFERPSETLMVELFEPGKRYGTNDGAELASAREHGLLELAQAILTRFCEFDLDFPGGRWEDLAGLLKERLIAAYAKQIPDFLKPHFPAAIDVDVSVPTDYVVRYPALHSMGLTLADLRLFRMAPVLEVQLEPAPRIARQEDGSASLYMEQRQNLSRWVLSDGNRIEGGGLEVAFFNLLERPGASGAEDVVALFEMAWKARGAPVFAQVKYHPETRTIMLRATPDEIASARRAFASLTGRPAPVEPGSTGNPFDAITRSLQAIVELLEAQKKGK
ncbi:MAG TPA: hypothetical protein VEJ18_18595 [Planctomycetota bacterium]|nr:hypothetical protein [Planctomycetota bacterium]